MAKIYVSVGAALGLKFRLQAVRANNALHRLKAELPTLSLAGKIITTTSPASDEVGRC